MAHRSKKKHLKHVRQHEKQQQGSREGRVPDSASRSRTQQQDDGPRDLDEGGERTGTRIARGASTRARTSAPRPAGDGARKKPGLVRTIARAATASLAAKPKRLLSKASDRVADVTTRVRTKATRRVTKATSRVRSMLGRDA